MAYALRTEHASGLRVDRAELLRYLGYAGQKMAPELEARIDLVIEQVEQASNPTFAFALFPVVDKGNSVELEGARLILGGNDIRVHLSGARLAAVCASTLGLSNEQALVRLALTNPLDAAVFDAASSALVETLADVCEARVAEFGTRVNLVTNGRFSPGYGDLPLNLQPEIARTLSLEKTLGISVADSHLLTPRKSTTAFIGLFEKNASSEDTARWAASSADDASLAASPTDDASDISRIKSDCDLCVCAASCALRKAGRTCYR